MTYAWGIAVVLVALGGLFGLTKLLRQVGLLASESSRKMVHIGMGIVCLSFPYVFATAYPVWILALLAVLALMTLRLVPPLKRGLGSVLHDVERLSLGELYFPLGVAAVFTLAEHRMVLFMVPVAILTFADAAGALVGKRFGRTRYATVEGTKTLEGSLAVGLVAAACAFVPGGNLTDDLFVRLTIAALVGLLCLLIEAISWRGLDNLFMPLTAFVQLSIYRHLPEWALLERLAVLTTVTGAAFCCPRGRWMDGSAWLGCAIALYFFWAICGWRWLAAPMLLLASYVCLMPAVPGGAVVHNLFAVLCVASAAVFWCTVASIRPLESYLWPFSLGLAAQQAMIAVVRYSQARPRWGRLRCWAAGTAQAAVVQFTAFLLLDRTRTVSPAGYAVGLAILGGAAAVFSVWEGHLECPRDLSIRWWKQGVTGFVASAAALICYAL